MKNSELSQQEEQLRTGRGIGELCAAIAETDNRELLEAFFRCLFTPAELRDIANRWLLTWEIEKGTTQREIACMFGMSLCKITRGSRELKKSDSAFRKMLEIFKKLPPDPDPSSPDNCQ